MASLTFAFRVTVRFRLDAKNVACERRLVPLSSRKNYRFFVFGASASWLFVSSSAAACDSLISEFGSSELNAAAKKGNEPTNHHGIHAIRVHGHTSHDERVCVCVRARCICMCRVDVAARQRNAFLFYNSVCCSRWPTFFSVRSRCSLSFWRAHGMHTRDARHGV